MTKDETIKQALEAYCKTLHPLWNTGISRAEAEGFFNAGFKAAQELPKQAQSEPVALKMDVIVVNLVREGINKHRARELAEHFIKHTTTPPQQEAKDEPVAWLHKETGLLRKETISSKGADWDENHWKPLYATPPKRKPLSDEEIEKMRHLIDWTAHWSYNTFARAIEAAHGIKGEA